MAPSGPRARLGRALSSVVSPAVLLREAARTSRRWQTYAARTGFSGVLLGVLLLGISAAISATRASIVDTADLAFVGRGVFIGFSVVQMLMAMGLAPLMTASAIAEETDERTMEMLVLTRLQPGQILLAKILSRVLMLVTIVAGALPVMALVVNLGGVSAVEVVAVTVHTLTTIAVTSTLGAFFALFTKSPMLAAAGSASYALPFFVMLPAAYVLCTGDAYSAAHFSTFAAPIAKSWSALVTPLSYVPSVVLALAVTTPLFQHKVSNASFEEAFSERVWRTGPWLKAGAAWFAAGVLVLPWAVPLTWWLNNGVAATSTALGVLSAALGVVLWAYWSIGAALGTWAFLRVGMDVIDGVDAVFSGGQGFTLERERRSGDVGNNPVWWREARTRAWLSSTTPMFVLWGLFLLGVFQTGWWIFPGGMLALGALNAIGAVVLAAWLATRSIAEERRRGTLEVLLCTTLPSRSIVAGKVAAAALPTLPLLLLSLPLLALGFPQLSVFTSGLDDAGRGLLRGIGSFLWLVPVWMLAIVASLVVALRSSRPAAAFGLVTVGLGAALGLPAILAHLFPDAWLVALPAQILAPPLAGSFGWLQLLLSTAGLALVAAALLSLLTSRLRSWAGLLGVLLALAVAAPSASAAAPSPEEIAAMEALFKLRMTVRPLADGWVREGEWTTLAVQVDNAGAATRGTVELVETTPDGLSSRTYRREVELPAGARKVVTLLVQPGLSAGDRVVSLSTREGRQAVSPLRLQTVGADDVVVAVIGPDGLGLNAEVTDATQDAVPGRRYRGLASGDRKVRTGLVPPAAMPHHSRGWGTVDWVVWPAADPSSLSEAQLTALAAWVADGGHLLLAVSDTWRQVGDSALAPLLPVDLQGVQDGDVAPLTGLLGAPGGGAAPVATASPRAGALVRARAGDGRPLWVSAARGLGSVHVLLADPRTAALQGVRAEDPLRRLLTLPGPGGIATDLLAAEPEVAGPLARALHLEPTQAPPIAYDAASTEATWEQSVRALLADIPGVAPLPLEWLMAFAVAYLSVIGPLDYLVLRALGRQPLTWITFPTWIALFAGGSLALTGMSKGSQAVVVNLQVADLLPDLGLWRGETYLGVFSTRKTRLSVESATADSVLGPMREAGFQSGTVVFAGDGGGRVGYQAETWTLAYLRGEWTRPAEGGVTVERTDAGWKVANGLPFDLLDAVVLFPEPVSGRVAGQASLGRIPAGGEGVLPAEVTIGPVLGPSAPPVEGEERSAGRMASLFAYSLPMDRGALDAEHVPVLLGVIEPPLDELTIRGLDPVQNRTVVVRVRLPALGEAPLDRAGAVAEVTLDRSSPGTHPTLSCSDGTALGVSVLERDGVTVLVTDPLAAGCDLSFYDGERNGWTSVQPGGRYRCSTALGSTIYECREAK